MYHIKKKEFLNKIWGTDKFNWENHSFYIPLYLPEEIKNPNFNWEFASFMVVLEQPNYIDKEKLNWSQCTELIAKKYPEKLCIQNSEKKSIIKIYPQYKDLTLKEMITKIILEKI